MTNEEDREDCEDRQDCQDCQDCQDYQDREDRQDCENQPITKIKNMKEYHKNYRQVNVERIREYRRNYYLQNKDKANQRIECPCGGVYTFSNKSSHFKTKRHQNAQKKDINLYV